MRAILPGDLRAGDAYGASTAVWSNRVAAGAPLHLDDSGRAVGAAYVYEFDDGTWVEAKLLAPDGADGDEFGRSITMCCDTVIVGAPGDDDNGESSGSAYVFARDGLGSWSLVAKLSPDDGAACDRFGWSVSLSAGVAVIGAWSDDAGCPGTHAAYIFEEAGGAWSQAAKLLPQSGDGSEQFGHAVATSVGRVLVGAWGNDDPAADAGALYAYEKVEDVWVVTGIHRADDASAGARFGFAVAASGDGAAAGAPGDADNGTDAGSVYPFSYANGAWTQHPKVLAHDGAPGDAFGTALDLTGVWAGVGAPGKSAFGNGGAVYFYRNSDGAWTSESWNYASGAEMFGSSVAVSGNTMLVGDPAADAGGTDSGSAYVITNCFADFNHDGTVDTRDVLTYLNVWNADHYSADCDGCGTVDTRDFICFLNEWTDGCS